VNVIRLHLGDRTEDVPIKTFDELTIEDWEDITRPPDPGESRADVLYRMFDIPHEFGALITNRQVEGLLRFRSEWITAHNRTIELIEAVRTACEEVEHKRLDAMLAVWLEHRPKLETITAFDQVFRVPQNIGLDLNYGQWVNLQIAIDSRARPADPNVEGDEGKPGLTITQFYATVLAAVLTSAADPMEWRDLGTPQEEQRFADLFESRAAVMRHARLCDAIEVCTFLLMQRYGLSEEVAPGLPRQSNIAAAQAMAGGQYFNERWGAYSQVAEPAAQCTDLARIHGDRGVVTNYPAAHVLRHMGYLTDRSRLDTATQRGLHDMARSAT
jgi:hypothetical protein